MTWLSIVVPTLDEARSIGACLAALQEMRAAGAEVVVVDGGSGDATRVLAAALADRVIDAPRGRASQMNAGAEKASGDVLLFLHADTRLPAAAELVVLGGLERSGRAWGRFDVTISGRHPLLAVVARMMNIRSRATGIATGDQAMFVQREVFRSVGGFPAIELMEDVALSKRLKRVGRPLSVQQRAITSGRRWETHGVLPTIMLMWRLRLAYFFGADPAALAKRYGYGG
jgi:rSAM/selenodomain-associated transferase 2